MQVLVSRTLLAGSPAALDINSKAAGYKIIQMQPGAEQPVNEIVDSKLSDGSVVVHTRMGTTTASLVVRVYGDTMAEIRDGVDDLILAFSQLKYTVTVGEGVETIAAWTGSPSVVEPDWDPDTVRGGWVDCRVSLLRQPRRP